MPRSTPRLIADAFALYRHYPLLFLALAAGVLIPYRLLVLGTTSADQAAQSASDPITEFALGLIEMFLIIPLISALHVHAVTAVREGEEPRLGPITKRGLAALPVVTAAAIMSGLGIFGGFALFVVPGIYLLVRWIVVAQTAAIEREGWISALRCSWSLTAGSSGHVLVFAICIGVITFGPPYLLIIAFTDQLTDVGAFLANTVVQIVVLSFTALMTALLYFDLRTRRELLAARWQSERELTPDLPASQPQGGLDPRLYSDQTRPKGWYIDPDSPHRMRYWDTTAPPGWRGSARAPRKLTRQWRSDEGWGEDSERP